MFDLPHFNELDFRLLFLDIDGVINSTKTRVVAGTYPDTSYYFPKDGKDPITGSDTSCTILLNDIPVIDLDAFDHTNIKLINRLCELTDTHIVLSSSWRQDLDVDQIRYFMSYIGFDRNRIIGKTKDFPSSFNGGYYGDSRSPTRGMEIKEFLKELSQNVDSLINRKLLTPSLANKSLVPKSYVIIDDTDDGLSLLHQGNFIETNELEGLTLQNTIHAGKILTYPSFSLHHMKAPLGEVYEIYQD